jgi:ribosomal protein L21E
MKRKGGTRRKSRSKYKKTFRQRGKISLSRYFQVFKPNETVMLVVEPAVQKGMYHSRYIGKSGVIKRKNGTCYEVTIMDRDKQKCLIVHPVHMKRI